MPAEKEFTITVAKDEDRLHVHSEIASIAKRLYHHPKFRLTGKRVVDGDIVRVEGTLPVGVLNVSAKPRQRDGFSPIVSRNVLGDS